MSNSGFTLIETLVAMSLTAMIAIAGTTLMVQTSDASSLVRETTETAKRLNVAHTLLRDDFTNATNRPTTAPTGTDTAQNFFGRPTGQTGPLVSFTRSNWMNSDSEMPRGDMQRVEYRLESGYLIRRAWLQADAVNRTPFVDREMIADVESINVRYISGNQSTTEWPQSAPLLPDAINLDVTFTSGEALALTLLVGGGG